MNNTTGRKNYFTINFLDKKIIGTKANYNKASRGFGPVYEELAEKMKANPNFELVVKIPKHNSNKTKRTYDGLNFKFMEDYFKTLDDGDKVLIEYKNIKKVADECGTSVYPFTKHWFLEKFGTEERPFDMVEAKEKINTYRNTLAKKRALECEKKVPVDEPDNTSGLRDVA